MAEEEDQTTRKLELSPVQVAASALAAVSAAFFASWAGTAGTMIGAALGSVIATVGAATYSYSLKRTSEIARRTALQVREGALLPPGLPRTRRGAGGEPFDETSVLPAADGEVGGEHAQLDGDVGPWWRRLDPRGKDLPWGRVALAAAAVMLVTMAVLTSFEGLTGRSVSDTVTGNDTGRTTVGNVFGGEGSEPAREPQPTEESPSQAPSVTPSEAPTSEPTEDPTESPTEEPTQTDAPVPTAPTPTLPTTPTPSADPDAGAGTPSPSPSS